jgi:hypothetical protein
MLGRLRLEVCMMHSEFQASLGYKEYGCISYIKLLLEIKKQQQKIQSTSLPAILVNVKKLTGAGEVAQMVKCLANKHKLVSSNPSSTKKKKGHKIAYKV